MAHPPPIVEGTGGNREFLISSLIPYVAPHVESRGDPFPDAGSIEAVVKARRLDDRWPERYGHGRAANNLAAVRMCTNYLQAAFEAIQEAEQTFLQMLDDNNPYPEPLTLAGLAMVQYNAAVLFRMPGDIDGNFAKSENSRVLAIEAIEEGSRIEQY